MHSDYDFELFGEPGQDPTFFHTVGTASGTNRNFALYSKPTVDAKATVYTYDTAQHKIITALGVIVHTDGSVSVNPRPLPTEPESLTTYSQAQDYLAGTELEITQPR
jgi:hypothetical protein